MGVITGAEFEVMSSAGQPGGSAPSTWATQAGSSTGTFLEEGNLYRQVSGAGISPGATGADNVLMVFSIPANAFDGTGNRGITVTASGSFAANGNTKQCKLIFNPSTAVVGSTVGAGGTTIADTGASVGNNVSWLLSGSVFKYGAANSNTQKCMGNGNVVGATHGGVTKNANATATENAAILVALTGNATTTASDILGEFLEVNFMN